MLSVSIATNSCGGWRVHPRTRETSPGVIGDAPVPHLVQSTQGRAVFLVCQCRTSDPRPIVGRGARETASVHPGVMGPRFFSPAQAHVAESVRFASAATDIPSQSATEQSYGTVRLAESVRKNEQGRLVAADGLVLCFGWQLPKGCGSTSHAERNKCSGCEKAQGCARAEKA